MKKFGLIGTGGYAATYVNNFLGITGLLLAGSLLCAGAEFHVKPDDGSFEKAAKNWK